MRILRVVSPTVSTSRFESTIPAPIICEPGTKIALKSLSLELERVSNYVVSDDSYYLIFGVGDDTETYKVTMPTGTYNNVSFLQKLKYLMNCALSGNPNDIARNAYGFEWNYKQNTDGRLVLFFGRNATRNQTSDRIKLEKMDYEYDALSGDTTYRKDTTSPDAQNFGSYGQCKFICARGGFSSFITLDTDDTTAAETRFLVGIHSGMTTGAIVTIDAMKFCVCNAVETGFSKPGKYGVKLLGGSKTSTDREIKGGDIISIHKAYDLVTGIASINFAVKSVGDAEFTTVVSQPLLVKGDTLVYDEFINGNMHYTFAFNRKADQPAAADVGFTNVAITESPFQIATVQGNYSTTDEIADIYYSDITNKEQSLVSLDLPSLAMRNLLGYAQAFDSKTAISGSFPADYIFSIKLNQIGDDLVVVINNDVELTGFDFLTGLKSNILAVIPLESLQSNVQGTGVSYIEPFPTFIDIKNKYPINLNTLNVSIKAGNNYIPLTDKVYMQILLD